MLIAYIGNFEPPHSTENDILWSLESLGHRVRRHQEGQIDKIVELINWRLHEKPDVVLWTRTKGLADKVPTALLWEMLAELRRGGIPIVGYHLDRWWGLKRHVEIYDHPFFRVDLLCTADGGHDEEWEAAGITHQWMPPAICGKNLGVGVPQEKYRSRIAFVGSWQDYHPEWKHRTELVRFLERKYGDDVQFWPRRGEHAIRGDELKNLYASVDVVVGDSCLVPKRDGSPMTHYCSDRIPETLGRGGILVHPLVKGINDFGDPFRGPCTWMWELGDWDDLAHQIETALSPGYEPMRDSAVNFIRAQHTYEKRMETLFNGNMLLRWML